MCGLILQLNCNESSIVSSGQKIFSKVQDELQIRGPDKQSYLAKRNLFLGHGRLSILDVDNGSQPMEKDGKVVVFNGEIYNFKYLKSTFSEDKYSTDCDSEILLSIPDINNPQQFLNSLRGMFAICLVDFEKERILAARDRFGKKPLFAANIDGKLFLSSRMKTISKLLDGRGKISPEGLGYFSDFGFIPAPFSIMEGVEKFLPGEWRLYNFKGEVVKKGSIDPIRMPHDLDPNDPNLEVSSFKNSIISATQRRLQSDRPLGILLSDGIDSSIIAHTIQSQLNSEKHIKAYILSSNDHLDESPGAIKFAKSIGIDYEVISMEATEDIYSEVLSVLDEPFADLSIFPTYSAFKALKKHATVAITGDGGDELFGGYPHQFSNRFILNASKFAKHYGPLRRLKLLKDLPHAFSKPSYLYRRISSSGLFHTKYYQELRHQIPNYNERYLLLKESRAVQSFEGDLEKSQWSNSISFGLLDRMLTKVDVCSMGAGVEARSPFLDEDLWNRCMVHPATRKDFENKTCKSFLKNYAAPFKINPRKSGFSMDYERFQPKQGAESSSMFGKNIFSGEGSSPLTYRILDDWINENLL